MRLPVVAVLALVAGVCVHMAHAVQNQVDLYAGTSCAGSPSKSYMTDDYGICKDNSGSTSAMMFCDGGTPNRMTLVTFTTTGCDRAHVDFGTVITADGLGGTNTCTATPDNTESLRASCAVTTVLPKTFNRILYDAASTSCNSAAASQTEVIMPNGACIPAPGGSGSMQQWCGDSNDVIVATFSSADCTGASAAVTVLQKENCGSLSTGGGAVGLKVTCNVGENKNVWSEYTTADCSGVPTYTIIGDSGKCYNSTDDTTSMLTFYKDGKVHTAWWDNPSCEGAATYSNLYASSTCATGEPSGGSNNHWFAEMHADVPQRPRVKVEHYYSSNNCGGGNTDADTTDRDQNGACFDHSATTTSLQAWCSDDRNQGVVSLYSSTGCGLPNHASTHDFQDGVCLAVGGSESIKVTCGATAATLSALVLALPLMLAAWLRNGA